VHITKNTTMLNAKYILIMTNVYKLILRVLCVMQYFSFMMLYCWKKIRSFDGIDWFWYIVESFWTFSNLQGLLFLRYLHHRSFGQTFCTYIYAMKWNINRANEINKLC